MISTNTHIFVYPMHSVISISVFSCVALGMIGPFWLVWKYSHHLRIVLLQSNKESHTQSRLCVPIVPRSISRGSLAFREIHGFRALTLSLGAFNDGHNNQHEGNKPRDVSVAFTPLTVKTVSIVVRHYTNSGLRLSCTVVSNRHTCPVKAGDS
jgi:hypothetical protein